MDYGKVNSLMIFIVTFAFFIPIVIFMFCVYCNYRREKRLKQYCNDMKNLNKDNIRWLKNNKVEIYYIVLKLSENKIFMFFLHFLELTGNFKNFFTQYHDNDYLLGHILSEITWRQIARKIPFKIYLIKHTDATYWEKLYTYKFPDDRIELNDLKKLCKKLRE